MDAIPTLIRYTLRFLCICRDREALVEASLLGQLRTYYIKSQRSGVPLATLHYHNLGRCSGEEKAQANHISLRRRSKPLKSI